MLVSLAADVHHRFDVLIVDDHSVRIDIEARARAWGVLTQSWGNRTEGRKGNTQTWNLAWQYLLAHDYQYLVLSNNDLIVPEGMCDRRPRGISLSFGSHFYHMSMCGWVVSLTMRARAYVRA